MSTNIFRGPLLFVILGGVVLLGYRFLPLEQILERFSARQGTDPVTSQAAPPLPSAAEPSVVAPPAQATPPKLVADPVVKVAPVVSVGKPAGAERLNTFSEPAVVAGVSKPVLAPVPALPKLRVFVQADVHERAGLGNITASRYADMLKLELAAVAADYLGPSAVQSGDANMPFREHLAQGREGFDRFCGQARAQRVLLADVVISAAGFSSMDSAYWPEVAFIAINCADGRVHKRPKKRLEPNNMDAFEFQRHFNRRSQDFIASQGYFLKP